MWTPPPRHTEAAPPTDRAVAWAVAAGAGFLALLVRWNRLGGRTGLYGYQGYDDGVYFTSAVAFVHDHLPYRDFLLLHPPGIMLALTPFALLTRWISDSDALAAARLGFLCLGAVNTVLVTRVARRWGAAAMVVAGLAYAVSSAAAYAERLTLLEPLGTLTLLASVLLLLRARGTGASWWWLAAGGAVLGLGPVVKIWNVVPAVIVARLGRPHARCTVDGRGRGCRRRDRRGRPAPVRDRRARQDVPARRPRPARAPPHAGVGRPPARGHHRRRRHRGVPGGRRRPR